MSLYSSIEILRLSSWKGHFSCKIMYQRAKWNQGIIIDVLYLCSLELEVGKNKFRSFPAMMYLCRRSLQVEPEKPTKRAKTRNYFAVLLMIDTDIWIYSLIFCYFIAICHLAKHWLPYIEMHPGPWRQFPISSPAVRTILKISLIFLLFYIWKST